MPLYEYECDVCHHRFEVIQRYSDSPKDACPKCGGPVHKLQSAPSFQFKGTGWYVTDYAKKDQGGSSKTSGDSSSESKGSSESSEKSDKSEKADKAEKSEKSEKAEKSDKSGGDGAKSSGDSSSSA